MEYHHHTTIVLLSVKDITPQHLHSLIVYKFTCPSCSSSYTHTLAGQTDFSRAELNIHKYLDDDGILVETLILNHNDIIRSFINTCDSHVITCDPHFITCHSHVITCDSHVNTCGSCFITCDSVVITCDSYLVKYVHMWLISDSSDSLVSHISTCMSECDSHVTTLQKVCSHVNWVWSNLSWLVRYWSCRGNCALILS